MKKAFALILALLMGLALCACGDTNDDPTTTAPTTTESTTEEPLPFITAATLIADRTSGNPDTEAFKKSYPYNYDGNLKLDPNWLAEGLTSLTGLDFFAAITVNEAEKTIAVDWAADSSLIAGLDDRDQKEEFHMYDVESLNWFMMDSMWSTLLANYEGYTVYYTANGGQPLRFEEPPIMNDFSGEYMGSAFYYAHDDVRGEDPVEEEPVG